MAYCKVVKVASESTLSGGERWVLTHECGKVEYRLARGRGKRRTKPAPTRVRCGQKGDE